MKDLFYKYRRYIIVFGIGIVIVVACVMLGRVIRENYVIETQQKELLKKKAEAISRVATATPTQIPMQPTVGADKEQEGTEIQPEVSVTSSPVPVPVMLPEYAVLYEENPDIIGWLSIDGTNVDYPVMQTPEDEQYYLYRDFYSEENRNGSLIMDTDSTVGIGCEAQDYVGGTSPSTNLIIHGHNMKSGLMFGKLDLYEEEAYGKAHNIICFDSLYEKREYELISVFRSKVYKKSDKVFKYYQFFQADTEEEFHTWYLNIKEMALYDTGVTAQFGDEFITLTCCTYHVEDGRFVVVGKRVK